MGKNTEREGLDKNKNCKETKTRKKQNASIFSLHNYYQSISRRTPVWRSATLPPVKTAPLTGSVKCRTEYATLWDTEYKETETEVCTTEYEKVCRTETQRLCQPTTRQECT